MSRLLVRMDRVEHRAEHHSQMFYRLAYQNPENPLPYAQSQWGMSPTALLTQRLRSSLAASWFSASSSSFKRMTPS
jgi:hypothetical protein